MRFMIIVRATPDTEAGRPPDEELFHDMAAYHEELAKAGLLLEGSGLQPSAKGWRIKYDGSKRTLVDGPFAETKELIAGYWILQVKSRDEAIEWAKRIPVQDVQIEIRPIFEAEDFGDEFTPELRAREDRLREQLQS
jgi:hypothetical protein